MVAANAPQHCNVIGTKHDILIAHDNKPPDVVLSPCKRQNLTYTLGNGAGQYFGILLSDALSAKRCILLTLGHVPQRGAFQHQAPQHSSPTGLGTSKSGASAAGPTPPAKIYNTVASVSGVISRYCIGGRRDVSTNSRYMKKRRTRRYSWL